MRNYKRTTNRGTTPQGVIERAVECVLNGDLGVRAAARDYNINHTTLIRYIKKIKNNPNSAINYGYGMSRRIFTDHQEHEIQNYLQHAADIDYGLSPKEVRRLAYEYALKLDIDIPSSWIENKMAGKEWFSLFMKRNTRLSLRTPEATSLARSTAFNQANIDQFFTKLGEVIDRYHFQAQDIWNTDETGVTTVQRPAPVVASKGKKQVGAITSAERGQLVTVCTAINAVGNFVPPMFVFPRKYFKDHFIRDGPPGCAGTANTSGWMIAENFLEFLQHFVNHVHPSKAKPVLLLLDNHHSHLAIDVINYAKDNGIIMLSFPPHCTHRLQPLDITVYGPFKKQINSVQDRWMRANPGKTMTIYDVPSITRDAWPLAASANNICNGFKRSGISPFNPDVFDATDFLPSTVTDRPMPQDGNGPDAEVTAISNAHLAEITTVHVDNNESSVCEKDDADPATSRECEVSIPNDTNTMQKWLSDRGLVTIPVPGDGHCLLSAFSLCLQASNFSRILTAADLCDAIKDQAHRHWQHYKQFAVKGQDMLHDVHRYVTHKQYNTDTGDLIIAMLCNAYSIRALVYTYHNNDVLEVEQKPWQHDAVTTIRLTLSGQHYIMLCYALRNTFKLKANLHQHLNLQN